MSEVQTNTEVGGESTIQKSGSSSDALTFDDLENLGNEPTKVDKDLKVDNKKDDSGVDKSAKKDEKKQDDSSDNADSKKSGQKVDDKKAGEEAVKVKTLKIKNGDADLELPLNLKIPLKVDGKDESFELQDVINEFSGKTNWGRKFQELDTERKTFHNERQELNDGINTLYDLAITKKDPMSAVAYLSDMLGGDGIKTVMEIQSQMFKEFEELSKLTPEQRTAKQAQDRADLLQKKLDQGKQTEAKKTEQVGIAKRVETIKTKYGMNDDRFKQVHESLKSIVKPEDLTPELVGEVHQRWTQQDQVDELVVELSITDEKAKGALLGEWYKDPSLTKEQISKIAVQVFGGKKPKSSLEKKIEKNGGGQQVAKVQQKPNNEPLTFDDL